MKNENTDASVRISKELLAKIKDRKIIPDESIENCMKRLVDNDIKNGDKK